MSAPFVPGPAGGDAVPLATHVTFGVLAGGLATRLDGRDKAWLERGGTPLILALVERFAPHVDAVLVSANRHQERYLSHGLRALHDRVAAIGPLGGLDALAAECRSPWLLTLPVDALGVPEDLFDTLSGGASASGAVAEDDDGVQPLVALWRRDDLRDAATAAIAAGDYAVHALQTRLGLARVRIDGARFGNLNTPADLAAAGIDAR